MLIALFLFERVVFLEEVKRDAGVLCGYLNFEFSLVL